MDNHTLIEFFPDLINEGDNVHTVMVEIPKFKELIDYIAAIPADIVYEPADPEYGKTKTPHVTVLYGIEPMEGEKAKALLRKIPAVVTATLGGLSLFETPKFDVLKIDVTSPYLSRINKFLTNNVEYHNDYPSYHPHVTLCYLKKGMGKELAGDSRFAGTKLAFKTFLYSDATRNKEKIPMKTPEEPIKEYGAGGGYGGATGGAVAASGWAGTFSSAQTSGRIGMYPQQKGYRDTSRGNVVTGINPYDTINDQDLTDPRFGKDEIRTGLRYEMPKMQYPNKDIARALVIANLEKNPKFYSDLHQYFDTQ
jgi:2'-5' RNA ligase